MASHKNTAMSCHGFTLLELLVSITILSLIITISYSALRMGTKSWDASIAKIEKNTNKRSAIALLKNKIEHIYPIVWEVNAKKSLAFQGSEESMQFIAPSPQGREFGEYFEYMFVINKGLSETTLELYYEPHYPGSDEFLVNRNSPYREILAKLKDAKFSYFGKPDNNSQEEWFDEWENDFSLMPSAVEIKLTGLDENDIDIDLTISIQSEVHQL